MAAEASASSQIIEAGHSVGAYTLTREIGKGSFAVVYQGKATAHSASSSYAEEGNGSTTAAALRERPTRVAIKIVTRKKLTAKLLENLEGEISILRTVRHANIVELVDCLKTSSHIYLIMQYCRMGDLSNFIRTRARIGQEKAGSKSSDRSKSSSERPDAYMEAMDARYPHPADGGLHDAFVRSFLAQLAGALQFMRARNIVHRDIKPQNLLLQEPEPALVAAGHPEYVPQVKVADFGFARHLEAASLAETLCGSPLYMAPEILRYEKYDAKADLWSVGAVLFEMCIGKPPFRASNHVELLRKIERGEDRIKFPDERSDESLKREHYKRIEEGRAPETDFVRPHTIADDLKILIRSLLKRKPVERLGFEEFFNSHVLSEYKETMRRAISVRSPTSSKATPRSSQDSSRVLPIATRPAPAVPNVEPHRIDSSSNLSINRQGVRNSARTRQAPSDMQTAAQRTYFAPRYVVGGAPSAQTKRVKQSSKDEQAKSSNTQTPSGGGDEHGEGETSSLEENALETPGSSVTHMPASAIGATNSPAPAAAVTGQGTASKPSSLYDEERGYVMVDKKSIDSNAPGQDYAITPARRPIVSSGWSPLGAVRRPSQLGRLASLGTFSAATAAGAIAAVSGSSSPSVGAQAISPTRSSPRQAAAVSLSTPSKPVATSTQNTPLSRNFSSSLKLGSTPPGAPFALPRGARRPSFHQRPSQTQDGTKATSPLVRQQTANTAPSSSSAPTAAPEVMRGRNSTSSPSQSHPSSALAKAISMASIRLFGVPSNMSLRSSAGLRTMRVGALSSSPSQAQDAVATGSVSTSHLSYSEQNLLQHLHDFGRKSFVLSEFADAMLSTHFVDGPHQNNHKDRHRRTSSSYQASAVRNSAANASSPIAAKDGQRVSSSASPELGSSGLTSTPSPSQVAASEALVLYVRSLCFLQRALDMVRGYLEVHTTSASSRYAYNVAGTPAFTTSSPSSSAFQPGAEVAETVQWLQAKFTDGVERANFAKSKAADELPDSAQNVDKMIFDKAIAIAHTAALDELARRGGAFSSTSTAKSGKMSADLPERGVAGSTVSAAADHSPHEAPHEGQLQGQGAGWNVEHCLLAYETASSMLMGLLDPGEDEQSDLSAGVAATVESFALSINKRIANLQKRYDGALSTGSSTMSGTVAAPTTQVALQKVGARDGA